MSGVEKVHGGLKVYTGAPAAARHYVEADRGRADDYYLTEGPGVARRFTATSGHVTELAPLSGETYEAWVAGLDPASGQPRGRLRADGHGVRFVEVVVNGPKSWSLAAALHPEIATTYEAAQDRAAEQVIGWLSAHATTRVGPRGGQVQVPLQVVEAATIRHYTSRAGDPHRHLHLQIGARVFAAGKWRGLHTVGVRDVINAVNGIGHAAMDTDPEFNAALAAHGFTKNASGEIIELADFVGPMSARARQIERHLTSYERHWTAAHPGQSPGPALRRAWHHRAWAQARPDKVTPAPGADLDDQWRTELYDLGFRPPATGVTLIPTPIGGLDREELAERALTRLAAGRSAWNAADVRGEVERLIAAAGVIVPAGVRIECAEDLTARAMARCRPLLDRDGLPEHLRAWTTPAVLAVEAELTGRLAARAAIPGPAPAPTRTPARSRLDAGQAAAAAALAGDRALVVVEGAAGAGKTATLAAASTLLAAQGHRLVVVSPTKKAAAVAGAQIGTPAGSAAWLAHQHGWRWTADGARSRLRVGDHDPRTGRAYLGPQPTAQLMPGDLLVVDEAGMADQDTTLALLTLADETGARVALLGDRHQLPAVGRGGVLDLAVTQLDTHAPAGAHLTLQTLHRFTRQRADGHTVPDTGYATLTLAMRSGEDPGAVFDALLARGQIRVHPDADALEDAVAGLAAAAHRHGSPSAVVVDTREQAAALNDAIRALLVATGQVDDDRVAVTSAGQRIGVGDRVATRRNDPVLGVANRDTWTVTDIDGAGGIRIAAERAPVTPARGPVTPARGPVTPTAIGERELPPGYVTAHLELAYATTAHGAQGDTTPAAHLVVGEHTGAATAYVGMTRGRQANTAHLVAADAAEAREQWIAVFTRDHADLGPAHAAWLVAAEADRYALPRPTEQVTADLHRAWTVEQTCLDRLAAWDPRVDQLREVVAWEAPHAAELATLRAAHDHASHLASQARKRAEASAAAIDADSDRIRDTLLRAWHADRGAARAAAQTVQAGPGRFGRHRAAVTRAQEQLTDWADRWRPTVPSLPHDNQQLAAAAAWFDDRFALWTALDTAARSQAERGHPGHAELQADAVSAHQGMQRADAALAAAREARDQRLDRMPAAAAIPDPEAFLHHLEDDLAATRQQLTDTRARLATLTTEYLAHQPAGPDQLPPADQFTRERNAWSAERDHQRAVRQTHATTPTAWGSGIRRPPLPPPSVASQRRAGPGIGR